MEDTRTNFFTDLTPLLIKEGVKAVQVKLSMQGEELQVVVIADAESGKRPFDTLLIKGTSQEMDAGFFGEIAKASVPVEKQAGLVSNAEDARINPEDDEAGSTKKAKKKSTVAGIYPTGALIAITGAADGSKKELEKRFWDYVKKNKLQKKGSRTVKSDEKLKALCGKDSLLAHEVNKLIASNTSATKPAAPKKQLNIESPEAQIGGALENISGEPKESLQMTPEPVVPPKPQYSAEKLAEFKAELEGRLSKAETREQQLSEEKSTPADPDDLNARTPEEIDSEIRRNMSLITQLKLGLSRIADNSFGICQKTGALIPEEIMMKSPWTTSLVK